jgi:hypothetical protein
MGERGTSSQVLVVFENHGWLEVEEGKNERELLLGGERRRVPARESLEMTLLSHLSNKGSRLH